MIKGNDNIHAALEKIAGREGATVGGAIPGILGLAAPAGAEEGKRLRAWLGALVGQIAGGAAASIVSRGRGGLLPALVGASGGGSLGAYYAHGPDKKKTASVASAIRSLPKKFWSDLSGKTLKDAKSAAWPVGFPKSEIDKDIAEAAKRQLRARLAAGGVAVTGVGSTGYALSRR